LISQLTFSSNKNFITGNKCEKIYTNKGEDAKKGSNHYAYKLNLLSHYIKNKSLENTLTIGIPRGLNMFENFPFWSELFFGCGINVVVSRPSTYKQYEKAIKSVMSDNICFPAKLMHGHIYDLLEMKVDRIFFPFVVYEKKEHHSVANSFNCPIVSAYSEVINSAIDTTKYNTPLDAPSINFNNEKLLKKAC
jgi:predicted nucleotide-binding protein (sugar kinase/HSP70/actin superfamily)